MYGLNVLVSWFFTEFYVNKTKLHAYDKIMNVKKIMFYPTTFYLSQCSGYLHYGDWHPLSLLRHRLAPPSILTWLIQTSLYYNVW